MVEFNFKSQRATTIEQSERLIALGLRKETADMHWRLIPFSDDSEDWRLSPFPHNDLDDIPAWSLHRLLSLIPSSVGEFNLEMDGVYSIGYTNLIIFCKDYLYDNIIDCIEWLIKEGYFNKEYLV